MAELHRYTITMTVLTEEPFYFGADLDDIWRECMEGGYVGTWDISKDEILTGKEMANALYAAGSQPEFFQLRDDGTGVEEEDAI